MSNNSILHSFIYLLSTLYHNGILNSQILIHCIIFKIQFIMMIFIHNVKHTKLETNMNVYMYSIYIPIYVYL